MVSHSLLRTERAQWRATTLNMAKISRTQGKENNSINLDAALLDAARRGDLGRVSDLLDRGADLNTADDNGRTPLIEACLPGKELEKWSVAGIEGMDKLVSALAASLRNGRGESLKDSSPDIGF